MQNTLCNQIGGDRCHDWEEGDGRALCDGREARREELVDEDLALVGLRGGDNTDALVSYSVQLEQHRL